MKQVITNGDGSTSGHVDKNGNYEGHTSSGQGYGHTYQAVVDDGTYTYFGELFAWDWTQFFHKFRQPVFTENTEVKWRLDRDNFILLDDTGKEFRMKLVKKRKDDTPAQPAPASPNPSK